MLKYVNEEFRKTEPRQLTDVELESALVVSKFAFSERVVVIEIVVKRLANQILHAALDSICKHS